MDKLNSKLVYGLIAVALVAVIAGVALSGGDDTSTTADTQTTAQPTEAAGDESADEDKGADREPAPSISGPDVADPSKTVALEDFRGKPVVVQVWASWCPICNDEAPEIAAFQKANPDVEFIGVNVEDTQSDAAAYKSRHGLTHEFDISDPNREVEGQLGFTGQPNSMVIDDEGRVVEIFPGSVTQAQLEEALGQI